MKNCPHCGGPLEKGLGNYPYTECELDDVVLMNVEVRKCTQCGDVSHSYGKPDHLLSAIARHVATKPALLSGKEIRFLRKHLGYSGVDYARHVGVTPETISRWENEKMEMGWTNELLLRMTVLLKLRVTSYAPEAIENPLQEFASVERVRARKPMCLELEGERPKNGRWRQYQSAAASA